ncbi:MAG TPA: hypothetical protein VFV19_07595 [Candidatus Polarisedimenticolaceae bacterium]|nr:hypothetical protein [Candidatus Polarisedimenticolaceae bacterium]
MTPKLKKILWIAPFAILALAGCIVLGGASVMWLWNVFLPDLFHVPRIGFWQGLGLLALARILFGGLGVRTNAGSRMRQRMEENRWTRMTDEERERLRLRMRERRGM